jgi:hypothetical protein
MSQTLLDSLHAAISEEIPGFAVVPKADSPLQRLIGKLMFFNRAYMERFTTTLYPKVYLGAVSVGRTDRAHAALLAHEFVHLYDQKRSRVGFPLKYLFPQVLALGAIGALWHPWFLACLLALLPLPAYWRMQSELRGYAMNCAMQFWMNGYIDPDYKKFVIAQFTGWNYYRMWPDTIDMESRLKMIEKDIRSGAICDGEEGKPYLIVRTLLEKHDLRRV